MRCCGAAGETGGQVRRTGPAIYIFISSSWRAIEKSRKKEIKKKEKKIARALRKKLWSQKIFSHSPKNMLVVYSFFTRFVRANRANSNSRLHSREKKPRREGYVAGTA